MRRADSGRAGVGRRMGGREARIFTRRCIMQGSVCKELSASIAVFSGTISPKCAGLQNRCSKKGKRKKNVWKTLEKRSENVRKTVGENGKKTNPENAKKPSPKKKRWENAVRVFLFTKA